MENKKISNKYYYKIYGLSVESEIEIPELILNDEVRNIDVKILRNKISDYIKKEIVNGKTRGGSKDLIWFYKENAGIFCIKNGTEIIVEDVDKSIDINKKFYLIEISFSFLMMQRNMVVLHGSSTVIGDKSIVAVGKCGAGKSTLVNELIKRKYKFLADDVVAISISDNIIKSQPSYPQRRLCKDIIIRSGYDINNCIRVNKKKDKYAIINKEDFVKDGTCIGSIIEIEEHSGDSVILEKITGNEKIKLLLDNIYNAKYMEISLNDEYLTYLLKISSNVPFYKIKRPKGKITVDEQIRIIEDILK